MKKILLLVVCFVVATTGLWAQQSTQVSGVVTENGQPMIGVSVVVKGTTRGTTTDEDGRYFISAPANATLVFSFMGYQTQEMPVNGRTEINVPMESDAVNLDEVMIVAYGSTKKESFTGSAAVVSAKKLEARTVANVTKAVEGTVAGVQTTSGSGQPGSGATIVVRGFGSINSSSTPLYVVDGAPYDGSISAINPDDIASMTILKDAAAGALYGARGANGVVLITTKRGADREGQTKVSLKATWGFASRAIPRYDLLDEKDYLEQSYVLFRNQAIYKDGVSPDVAGAIAIQNMLTGPDKIFGENQQYNPYDMPVLQLINPVTGKVNPNASLRYSEDWLDAVTASAPLRQEYVASISGGSRKTMYYVSLGYLDEEGLLETTSFNRISGRANLDTRIKDWWKLGVSANLSFNKTDNQQSTGTSSSNVWFSAQNMGPIYPVYELDSSGQIIRNEDGTPVYDYGLNRPSGANPNFNSVALLYDDKYYSNSDNLTARAYTEFALSGEKYGWANGLSFKMDLNVTNQNSRGTQYFNPYYGNAGGETQGRLDKTSNRVFSYTFNQILGYGRTFGKHTVDVLAGHEFYAFTGNSLQAAKTKFALANIYELNPGAVMASMSSVEDNYRIESYLSRAKYSYDNRYNLEASFRTDGSSRFHPDHRWGMFWSVGGNWQISNEAFMKDVSWVNSLSLRASYGEQGNDNVNTYYAWQSFYDLTMANAQNNGSALSSVENKDLTWEKNGNMNIGIDARLFNRVNLTFEFFNRVTTDMLLDVPMASSLGFSSYRANVGSMYNRGFEFSLGIDLVRSENFDWRLNILGSAVKNKITKLATETPIISGSYIYKEGEPIYSFYLPESAGVDPATGKQLYYVWDTSDPVTDEQISPAYVSADPSKAASSRKVAGNKMPILYGSVGMEFTIFKNIDLSVLTTYSIGGKTTDGMYNTYMEPLYAGSALHEHVKRAWQKPGDMTDIPRLEFNSGHVTTSSQMIDASYFSLKNITLGYTLPKEWVSKVSIDNVRVFVTGDNLLTFNNLNGFDPQASLQGSSAYTYVPVRTISFGVNLNF